MKDKNFKLILCDLGNVLLKFDHRIAVRKITEFTSVAFDDIYQFFFDSILTRKFEEGKISPLSFFEELDKRFDFKKLNFDGFVPIWGDIFSRNEGMLELLKVLKKKYKLHLVSNINQLHYEFIAEHFPDEIKIFDKIFLSYEVGFCKPAREIYSRAMEENGFSPDQTVYIDDREDLVKAASAFGINSVIFKSVASLREDLIKIGAQVE